MIFEYDTPPKTSTQNGQNWLFSNETFDNLLFIKKNKCEKNKKNYVVCGIADHV